MSSEHTSDTVPPNQFTNELDSYHHRYYVSVNESLCALCATASIKTLKIFVRTHKDCIDITFRNYQAYHELIRRCDKSLCQLFEGQLGIDTQALCTELVKDIRLLEPHVICFVLDVLADSDWIAGDDTLTD